MGETTTVVTEIRATCLGCGRIERIQGDIATPFVDELMQAGARAERERIVGHLRARVQVRQGHVDSLAGSDTMFVSLARDAVESEIDAIERGELLPAPESGLGGEA